MREIIAVGDDVHEIETRPITLICKSPEVSQDVEYANRLKLDFEACIYHVERTKTYHNLTPQLVAKVFEQLNQDDVTPDNVRNQGIGIKHVAGRVDMTLKYMDMGVDMGVPIAWVYPEAGLHPKAQCELGDLAIFFANYQNRTN